MLVSRQSASEQSPWSISSKFENTFHKSTDSLRMSNHFDSVTQSDWQGQYSFLPPGDNNLFSQQYDHVTNSTDNNDAQTQPRSVTTTNNALDIDLKQEGSPLEHRLDPLGLRQPKQPSPIPEQPENQGEQYAAKAAELSQEESLASAEAPGISMTSNQPGAVSSTGQAAEIPASQPVSDSQSMVKEEEDDVLEDEEMIEAEGDGEAPSQPQTAAERTAQRRKMKRFRYMRKSPGLFTSTTDHLQADPSANTISHERVCETTPPRRGAQRAPVEGDSRLEPTTGPSVVSEQVGIVRLCEGELMY